MSLVNVIRETPDKLKRATWQFLFVEYKSILVLQKYSVEIRKTTRHKYRVELWYDRIDNRGSFCRLENIPFSDDIKQEALDKFISEIEVVKGWSPYEQHPAQPEATEAGEGGVTL